MIFIGCDHAAVELKNKIVAHLKAQGYEACDEGAFDGTSVDYPDYAEKVCLKVLSNAGSLGILICGTGIGMSMAANKFAGIRCAHCTDTFSAKATREHNDANVLALGERITGAGLALDIVDAFVNNTFSKQERHQKRIDKLRRIEEKYHL